MASLSEYWQLIRQDDNGNRLVMGKFGSMHEAEEKMEYYQSMGHKQTYWVEKGSEG